MITLDASWRRRNRRKVMFITNCITSLLLALLLTNGFGQVPPKSVPNNANFPAPAKVLKVSNCVDGPANAKR